MGRFQEVNPTTGEVIGTWETQGHAEVDQVLARAREAFLGWRERSFAERGALLERVAALFEERGDAYARLMAQEMGKPIVEGRAEAEKCAWTCRYYAEHAERFLAPREVASDASKSLIRSEPYGVILAIMPWSFPFWQVFRFAAPALMAGNGVVLKHAPNTLGCSAAIVELCRSAGLPAGLVEDLVIDVDTVPDIIADPRVSAVTVTGRGRAGIAVAARAARHLKKTVLELGGSDAFIVLEDADLAESARVAAASRLINSGQSCIAAKRFIVVEAVAEAFVDRFAAELSKARVGDPLSEDTDVGPLGRADQRETLHAQVRISVDAGAELRMGGQVPQGPGFFYPVTLLTGVAPGMPTWDEEVFGPVAAVRVVPDQEAAVAAANESAYGLGASVWTRDVARGEALAGRIQAGLVFVNGLVRSDPRLPFGGIKRSGYGRELGELGIHEFVNHKTVWIG